MMGFLDVPSSIIALKKSCKKTDLRTTTKEARTQLRKVAIRLYKNNQSKASIARELGLRRMTVINWINKYLATGTISKQEKDRGRPTYS